MADVAGNVYEWISNFFSVGDFDVSIYRGGSWIDGSSYLYVSFRDFGDNHSYTQCNVGFRACR
jgi:formylglycine-generating enzyme required for sulfatase activity